MMRSFPRRIALVAATFVIGFVFALHPGNHQQYSIMFMASFPRSHSQPSPSYSNRKLLHHADQTDRIGEACSKEDIVVYQGATTPLPNGIPTYSVQILNVCVTGCTISGIHLNCGWFSSARMINPKIFKRLKYNDCLVNDGMVLDSGGSLSFQYANTFRYSLSVSSVTCH